MGETRGEEQCASAIDDTFDAHLGDAIGLWNTRCGLVMGNGSTTDGPNGSSQFGRAISIDPLDLSITDEMRQRPMRIHGTLRRGRISCEDVGADVVNDKLVHGTSDALEGITVCVDVVGGDEFAENTGTFRNGLCSSMGTKLSLSPHAELAMRVFGLMSHHVF